MMVIALVAVQDVQREFSLADALVLSMVFSMVVKTVFLRAVGWVKISANALAEK